MNNDQLISAIYYDLERATDYSTTQLREIRKKSWDRVLNRPLGNEAAGRSAVRSTLIRDTGFALLSTICPSYDTDSLVSFQPEGPDDVDQADAESRACNSLFVEDNSGYLQLCNAIADALWWRNGILKCFVMDKTETNTRSFMLQPGMTPGMVSAGQPGEWEHIDTDDDGMATFKVTQDTQELIVQSIEPAYFYVDPNQQDQNLNEAQFLAERVLYTKSELREMGVKEKIVAELQESPDETITEGIGASNTDLTAKLIDGQSDIHGSPTEDQERVECWWIHMQIDRDGDGISERWRFLVSHRQLLLDDPVEFFPYASGTGWIIPHRWSGHSLYDLLIDTEMQQTNARRQLNDNMSFANNQRPIFDPGTTKQDDILNGAPGRGIRSTDPASVGWMPFTDVTSNSLAYMQYLDGVAQDQAGAALQMMSAEGQTIQQASGLSVEMQLAPREQMAAQVSRNIAQTMVRRLFLIMHETLRQDWEGPLMYRKSGDWQETYPREWKPRKRCNIIPALSPGEKRRKASNLMMVRQDQAQLIMGGGAQVMVNMKGFFNATRDWLDCMGLDPDQDYYLDPMSAESQQAQQAQNMEGQQQGQMEQQMLQQQMQWEERKVAVDEFKAQTDAADKQFDNETDRLKLQQEGEIKEAELTVQAIGQTQQARETTEDKPVSRGD